MAKDRNKKRDQGRRGQDKPRDAQLQGKPMLEASPSHIIKRPETPLAQAVAPASRVGVPPSASPSLASSDKASSPAIRSLDQRRAKFALDRIGEHLQQKSFGNYRAYARGLPAAIVTNGLGQALAFEMAAFRKDPGHELLFDDVSDWLLNRKDGTWGEASPYKTKSDILRAIVNGSLADYLRAQEEAMALLRWLKVFAEAYIGKREDSKRDDQASSDEEAPS